MNMNEWTYVPEFTKALNGDIVRNGPPKYVHSSGVTVDVNSSRYLTADILDVEGKHNEAENVRAAAAGDNDTFQRLLNRYSP